MIAMTAQGILLAIWICFTVMALIGVIAVFLWAVRARQFSGQDRARHLPLRSGIPRDGGKGAGNGASEEQQGRGKNAPV